MMYNEVTKIFKNASSYEIASLLISFLNNAENTDYFLSNIENCTLSQNDKILIGKLKEIKEVTPLKKKLLELIDYNYEKFNSIVIVDLEKVYTKDDLNMLDMSISDILDNIDYLNFNICDDCFTFNSKQGLLISMNYREYIEYIDTYINTMNYEQLIEAIELIENK